MYPHAVPRCPPLVLQALVLLAETHGDFAVGVQDAHVEAALKEGVRVTLRMGEQPSSTNICGQQLYEAELAHPAGQLLRTCSWRPA